MNSFTVKLISSKIPIFKSTYLKLISFTGGHISSKLYQLNLDKVHNIYLDKYFNIDTFQVLMYNENNLKN